MPSGIIESLLTRVYLTLLRGTASSPSPGMRTTMRCSLSSAIRPVRLRPSLVTTVTLIAGPMTRLGSNTFESNCSNEPRPLPVRSGPTLPPSP